MFSDNIRQYDVERERKILVGTRFVNVEERRKNFCSHN